MKISPAPAALGFAIFLAALGGSLRSETSPSQRIPQFENADVKVWKTTVLPNAPLAMHTHEHARVIVALSGGTMKIAYADGKSEIEHWETGKAYWLSQEEGKRQHADANVGTKPIEVMVVEIKNEK